MPFSVLNNIPSLVAQNALNINSANVQRTLSRLSTGLRIVTGADDAAGLAIADGLRAGITALQQSVRNINDGIGLLQVADGALSKVTDLLNRAVTLATEAANDTLTASQRATLDAEFTAIKNEIDAIGSKTQFNGGTVFTATARNMFFSDGTSAGAGTISVTVGALSQSSLGLSSTSLSGSDGTNAQSALTAINSAISTVASQRGDIGAGINRLQARATVIAVQVQNFVAAEDQIRAANVAEEISNLTKFSILNQTGLAALAQANSQAQSVLSLLQ